MYIKFITQSLAIVDNYSMLFINILLMCELFIIVIYPML